jgi:Ca2+-binding RTX toxin-like protein
MYPAGVFPNRDAGWKTFNIDIEDPLATEVPEGWVGFGGPENPETYMPQLPPDRTFADVLAGIDEIVFHSIEPGYFYAIGFLHDLDFDNISIGSIPQICNGQEATIYVDYEGIIRGGHFDGRPYTGVMHGTDGNDVIVGGPEGDTIVARDGHDMICGGGGDDNINGQYGDDFIDGGEGDDNIIGHIGDDFLVGGEGRDHLNGGPGADSCLSGEVVNNCGTALRSPGAVQPRRTVQPEQPQDETTSSFGR